MLFNVDINALLLCAWFALKTTCKTSYLFFFIFWQQFKFWAETSQFKKYLHFYLQMYKMAAHPLLTNKWNFINFVADEDKSNDMHICRKFWLNNFFLTEGLIEFFSIPLITCCPSSVHLSVYLTVSLSVNFSFLENQWVRFNQTLYINHSYERGIVMVKIRGETLFKGKTLTIQ